MYHAAAHILNHAARVPVLVWRCSRAVSRLALATAYAVQDAARWCHARHMSETRAARTL